MQNAGTPVNVPQPSQVNPVAVGNCGDGQQMNFEKVIIYIQLELWVFMCFF